MPFQQQNVSYQLSELVAAGDADPLGGGRAVEPERTLQAGLLPGGGHRVFDGEEVGGGQEEWRLADGLRRDT